MFIPEYDGHVSEVFILSAARTPIGKFGGGLSTVPATDLGATAIRAAVERSGIAPEKVDEAIMGQVIQAGAGQAPARQAALKGGLPEGVSATTINKVCGSGMKAVMLGAASIRAGDADVIVAGGMENMNLGPYLLPGARAGYRLGNRRRWTAPCTTACGARPATCTWACTPSAWPRSTTSAREAQDEFALRSHQRALAAIEEGRFRDEIVPVTVAGKKGPITVDTDENPRPDTSLEALARLKPAFQPDRRNRHGRQRPRHHRWRGRAGHRFGPRSSTPTDCSRWPGSSATRRPTSPPNGCSRRRSTA